VRFLTLWTGMTEGTTGGCWRVRSGVRFWCQLVLLFEVLGCAVRRVGD
jgi:hypothetical protein